MVVTFKQIDSAEKTDVTENNAVYPMIETASNRFLRSIVETLSADD